MPAWKSEPLITYPPLEQWPMLVLPWSGFVERIDSINMPNLTELICENQLLTTLPWNDLKNLASLDVYSCQLTKLEIWRLPKLNGCYAGNNKSLLEVDAHGNTNITELDVYFCTSLTFINLQGCTNMHYLYLMGCALPQAMIDQVLTDMVASGMTNGYLDMSSGANAAPSNPNGVALKNTLISRGWTVTTN